MARSLTIDHREEPGTSRLLNIFLALSFGWLVLGMFLSGAQADTQTDAESPVQVYAE